VATPLIEWRTKMRGGYAAIPLFTLLVIWWYLGILEEEHRPWWRYLLLGLAMGGAWFNSTLSLSLIVATLLHSLLVARRFYRWAALAVPVGAVLALSPLVSHELRTGFGHTRYLLSFGPSDFKLGDVQKVVGELVPRFFFGRNVDQYVADLHWLGWLEYGLYAGMMLAGIFMFLLARPAPGRKRLMELAVLAVLVHLALFSYSRMRAESPRYLLPLYPPMLLFVVAVHDEVCAWPSMRGFRYVTSISLGLLIGVGIYNNVRYLHPSTVTDDVLLTDGTVVNVQTDGDLALRLVEYLRSEGVAHVRTGYFLQWRILFEGQESIIASSAEYFPTVPRFAEYDTLVSAASRVAIVHHRDSLHLQRAERTDCTTCKRVEIDNYVVLVP
jgi:hypothetical protein